MGLTAVAFLKSGIDFQIIGKDLSRDLIEFVKDVARDSNIVNKATGMPELGRISIEALPNMIAVLLKKRETLWHRRVSKKNELKELRANSEVLQTIIEHLQNPGPMDDNQIANGMDLVKYLHSKLGGVNPDDKEEMERFKAKDPTKFITLTTAHKAKGLEWDRTFLLQPKAYNPNGDKIRTEEDAQQEKNSWYVAATRGKNVLMVSADDQPKSGGEDDEDPLDLATQDLS